MLAQLFHCIVAAYYLYVSHWMIQNIVLHKRTSTDPQIKILQEYSFRFLTNWTFILQTVYFVSCVFDDLLELISGIERFKSKFRNIKTYFFTSIVCPVATLVTFTFWGIWAIDRNLIFPKALDLYLPPWINHSLHTVVFVFAVSEIIICHHKYPSFYHSSIGLAAFLATYTVCLFGTYFESGIWLYPFLKELNWTWRFLFFIGCFLFALLFMAIDKFISSLVWSKNIPSVPKKKQKKKN
ncbi:androgen-dependent TFPI-regulating protein-like [Lycorma delicatula]|uniref:androgen-dependent TFPI-regulating protein-like n=1 Tax=Lycorma delicatula TaxID=130591 RepID=UPI003F51172F